MGYLGKPTVVDNVETLAQATEVVVHGGAAFAGRGTRASTGTKVLSVSGDCERPGIYEYPFGVRIARVLEDCGARDAAFVQVSGPSGICLTPDEFHRAIAFEDVATAGAFMIFDSSRDYFEIARNFAHFFAHESCGFCTPCRVGTALQRGLMDKIADGRGSHYEVNELMRLSELMKRTSHCGLGQTAGHPFNDAWRKFRPAFEKRLQARDFAPADRPRGRAWRPPAPPPIARMRSRIWRRRHERDEPRTRRPSRRPSSPARRSWRQRATPASMSRISATIPSLARTAVASSAR